MIKWIHKPCGNCPVQAEGFFLKHFFYFRARGTYVTITFAKSQELWEEDITIAHYTLKHMTWPEAGWLPKWKCRLLIWKGCLKFLFHEMKECKHKWKFLGFYNGGYYNTKTCVNCNKLEIERSNTKENKKSKVKKI